MADAEQRHRLKLNDQDSTWEEEASNIGVYEAMA